MTVCAQTFCPPIESMFGQKQIKPSIALNAIGNKQLNNSGPHFSFCPNLNPYSWAETETKRGRARLDLWAPADLDRLATFICSFCPPVQMISSNATSIWVDRPNKRGCRGRDKDWLDEKDSWVELTQPKSPTTGCFSLSLSNEMRRIAPGITRNLWKKPMGSYGALQLGGDDHDRTEET